MKKREQFDKIGKNHIKKKIESFICSVEENYSDSSERECI